MVKGFGRGGRTGTKTRRRRVLRGHVSRRKLGEMLGMRLGRDLRQQHGEP